MAFTHIILYPALMHSGKYHSSALDISVLSLRPVCVIYGFMVNNSLMLFPLSDWFVTPSQKEWHYSCCGGGTAINVMSQAVNVIALQTQRGSLNPSPCAQTGDPSALHNNDGTCHRWFILPLNLLAVGPCGIAFKRSAQRWDECSVPKLLKDRHYSWRLLEGAL